MRGHPPGGRLEDEPGERSGTKGQGKIAQTDSHGGSFASRHSSRCLPLSYRVASQVAALVPPGSSSTKPICKAPVPFAVLKKLPRDKIRPSHTNLDAMEAAEMEDDYIFIQRQDETGVFIKESTITSVRYDQAKSIATIATDDGESYAVVGVLAVHQLHDHFYQRSPLKLLRDKQ